MVDPKLLKIFSQLVTPQRKTKLETTARNRVHDVAILLENITNIGNENAVARTMDGLGFQTLHTVRNRDQTDSKTTFRARDRARTDAGSRKWLTIHNWSNIQECIQHIKSNGFLLLSTDPNASVSLYDVNVNQKIVIAFGSEVNGISKELRDASSFAFSLPMFGMVDSYNISVAVAITLFHIRTQLIINEVNKVR